MEAMAITFGVRIYPYTVIAKIAVAEGVISSRDDLFFPRFSLAKGLEGWLPETLKKWAATRPHWFV